MKVFSIREVSFHNKVDDAWIVINGFVYDVTKFADLHPGGKSLLVEFAGKDATDVFFELHRMEVLKKFHDRLLVGKLQGNPNDALGLESFEKISKIPYAETAFFQDKPSPYYNESHIRFRQNLRRFVEKEMLAYCEDAEVNGTRLGRDFKEKLGNFGFFACAIGPGKHLGVRNSWPILSEVGLRNEDFDNFHETIVIEEMSRMMCPGVMDGLFGGRNISVPTLLNFGFPHNKILREQIAEDALLGKVDTCLAITEPFVGSDVASLKTHGHKITENGEDFYVINGVKKWITEGIDARYFITAFRTGKEGAGGIFLILIDREAEISKYNSEGDEAIQLKRIKTVYSASASTSLILFENCKVPAKNLLCPENHGFKAVMHNFNHERWYIVVALLAKCRMVVKECFQWANQRNVFGKKLISQPVIQDKFASMISKMEACQSWLDNVTYQMKELGFEKYNDKLGGDIALLKYEAAKVAEVIATESVQIFGGRALTKQGMGRLVERFQTSYRLPGVYGGSTEIMGSLGIRQALKKFPLDSKL